MTLEERVATLEVAFAELTTALASFAGSLLASDVIAPDQEEAEQ